MTRYAWSLQEGRGVVDLREMMLRMQTEYLDTMDRHSQIGADA